MIDSPEGLHDLIEDLRHQQGDTTDCEVKRGRDVELQMLQDRQRQAALDTTMWVRDDVRHVPDSGIDDLDSVYVDTLLRNARNASPFHRDKSDEVLLRNLGVVAKNGLLTVAGAYVLAEYPQRFLPSWSATAAVQLPTGAGSRNRDLQHFEGPLPVMFAEIRDWVGRNMHTTIGYRSDGDAVDESELPSVTVRELIGNALVHRDLSPHSHGKRVEVRLTGDRLTVSNPGGLRGITTAQLGHLGGKHAVNETVYALCQKLTLPDGGRVIEGEGGGIREARERMRAAGLKPLKFHDSGVSFTAVVSRRRLLSDRDLSWLTTAAAGHRLTEEQRVILASMHHGQEWTNRMVRQEFDQIDSREATSLLQDLVSRGLAVVAGERGGARYRLSGTLDLSPDDVLDVAVVSDQSEAAAQPESSQQSAVPNGDEVVALLSGSAAGLTVAELIAASTLTERQVRYALSQLSAVGAVSGRGHRPVRWTVASR